MLDTAITFLIGLFFFLFLLGLIYFDILIPLVTIFCLVAACLLLGLFVRSIFDLL